MSRGPSAGKVFMRLLGIAWPYRFQAITGLLLLGITASLMGFMATLFKPIVNMATLADHAGERSWLRLIEAAGWLEALGVPARDWGRAIVLSMPEWLNLGFKPTTLLLCLVSTGVLCALGVGITQYLGYVITHRVALRALTDVRSRFNAILLGQRFEFFDRYRPGELMSKVQNDLETMSLALIFIFNEAPKELVQILVGVPLAVWQAPYLAAGLLVLPAFVVPLRRLGKHIKRSSRHTLEMRADLTDVMHQQFGGMREIKGFRLERLRQSHFETSNESVFDGLMGVVGARGKSRALVEGGGHLVVMGVVVFAVYLAIKKGYTFGEFSSFMAIIATLVWQPLRSLSNAYNNFQNALPGAINVLEILDHPDTTPEPASPKPFPSRIESVEYARVGYSYGGGPSVLENVSFRVGEGRVAALVGHTGSGKSTLMDLLPRFRDCKSGSVLINGVDVRDFSVADLRDHVAYVGQDPYLFNASVRDNLLLGLHSAMSKQGGKIPDDLLWSALQKVRLADFIRAKPEGLDFMVGERGGSLSGGQRQRLAIARAILKDAPILILDEATSSQDSVTEREIQESLDVLMKGRTTFVIAHRLATVRHADILLILRDGRLVETGTHDELLKSAGEYARLHTTQFAGKS
ncbi:MAG: ABC transporter ATP-binding protein [Planctomycetota bacterium]